MDGRSLYKHSSQSKTEKRKTYACPWANLSSEVVADLVSEGQYIDVFSGHSAIVHDGDDARVERLPLVVTLGVPGADTSRG